jgi:uncharacterized protein (DUF1501 family)
MNSTRREFFQQAGAAVVGATAVGGAVPLALAAPARPRPIESPTLIAVYLRGGADPLSAVVPFADKDYPRHRPSLALGRPDSRAPGAVLPLDDRFGFNPSMKHLHALYEKGLCVPIVAVGSPHPTRSHFDAQDFMERGAPGQRLVATGWLNRYLQETKSAKDANLRAVSLQSLLPRSLRGDYPVLAKPDQKAEQAMAVYAQLYMQPRGKPAAGASKPPQSAGQQTRQAIQEFGARTIEQLYEMTQILEAPAPAGPRYPNSSFGRQMRDIARLIKARRGLEVTALDYGGWDHHINEGPVNGQMARQLGDVSASIGAFVDDVGALLMKNVLILVMSEFGRTVKENDNNGTDHGHGGFMLAVGGRVNGKAVYGKWTGLADNQLYEKRDLPVHTDFRMVFAAALKGVFGFDGMKAGMFPEYTPDSPPLDYLRGG